MSKIESAIGVIDGASDGLVSDVDGAVGPTAVGDEHVVSTSSAAASASFIAKPGESCAGPARHVHVAQLPDRGGGRRDYPKRFL
jgi:hypothetical protein